MSVGKSIKNGTAIDSQNDSIPMKCSFVTSEFNYIIACRRFLSNGTFKMYFINKLEKLN